MIPTPFDVVKNYALISEEPSGTVWPRVDVRLTEAAAFSLIFVIDRANRKVSKSACKVRCELKSTGTARDQEAWLRNRTVGQSIWSNT